MPDFKPSVAKGRELLGGDLLAQSIKHLGTEVAFGIHGGHLDQFLIGSANAGIQIVDTRNEATAVHAAEGYAKLSGKVGVAFVTANSGFANGFAGLMTAYADQSPIFVITSSAPLHDAESNVLQAIHDQVVLARPTTKFAYRCTHVEEIPRVVAHAFRESLGGKQGPTLIDFPIDVLFTPVQTHRIMWGAINSPIPVQTAPHPDAVKQVLDVLRKAKRPAIVTGPQATAEAITAPLTKLIESQNIPIFRSIEAWSRIPNEHPLFGSVGTNLALLEPYGKERPDLVLLLGTRAGFMMGNRGGVVIPDAATLVQVYPDAGELGRVLPVHVGVASGSVAFVEALLAALGDEKLPVDKKWANEAAGLHRQPSPHDSEPEYPLEDRMHPHHALKRLFSAIEPGAVILMDGGDCSSWSTSTVHHANPHAVICPGGYMGMLGSSWGYVLGASFAAPDRQIVYTLGDGSAGFHTSELDTYKRFNRNILTVVINNFCWGMSINGQDAVYEDNEKARVACFLDPVANYAQVGIAFGQSGQRVTKLEEIEPAVKKLSAVDGPAIIDLITSHKPTHPGTLAMVGLPQKKDADKWICVPYYDNLPRPFYKV